MSYAVNKWDYLQAYLYDGALEIDNNLVENAIRPNALGRKNFTLPLSKIRIKVLYS